MKTNSKRETPMPSTEAPEVAGPDYLVPLLHRSLETIKVDARRKPESLPPRLVIPGSKKLLWLKSDVHAWIAKCRTQIDEAPRSIFRGRRPNPT
jgi:hypothetical protein